MLTVRMNWMDVERSCSADVQLSKDSKDIPVYLRNKLYHHRAQVASTIRQQLAAIKRELNGDDDEKQTEETKAAEALTALIKGQRYRDGKLYTCYMDGTSHEGCETVTAYNAYCRKRLDAVLADNKDITALVPDASEFDVSAIDTLVNEESDAAARSGANRFDEDLAAQRTDLHHKVDAARKAYNDKASKCARYLTSFVAIRNAKLSEGFDPSTVEHKATPAISPRLMGAADDSDAVVPAETDDSQQAAGASNSAEDVPEGNGEDAVEVKGGEDDEISLESDADEAAKAAENNAAMIEAAAGGDPLLRDGTVAMTQ